ncbi:MAG: multifunctional CCA addition/repair protein [Pseudomonadota bacterium]
MKTFLVGGAVRDAALKLPVADRDWVVVGATPADMQAAGYRQVGKDFPVFLHPDTHEEHALARTERKTRAGHHGFDVDAGPHVTLEQDLSRRDLTINAMAQTGEGDIVDPWGGLQDIQNRRLRHVSDAFTEDPLRVLRTARFAARFAPLGFTVAAETLTLMQEIVASGELATLPAERIQQELQRALATDAPRRFIEVLRQCGALQVLWPELDRLFGVPQPIEHHPEVDSGEHTLLALDRAVALGADTATRFAVLCHDLGKGTTDPSAWPRHIDHENRGVPLVNACCKRLKAPTAWRELAVMSTRWHLHSHRADNLRPGTLVDTLTALDALRRPARFEQFLTVCEADARGRAGLASAPYPQADTLRRAAAAMSGVDAAAAVDGVPPEQRQAAVREARIRAVRDAQRDASDQL